MFAKSLKKRQSALRAAAAGVAFESLESRQLRSVTPSFDWGTGILTVNGSAGNDNAEVVLDGYNLRIRDNGVLQPFNVYVGLVRGIAMNGNAGNDVLRISYGLNSTLKGGSGNDILYGGTGNDVLDGGDNNDQQFGGNGNDTILANAGADYVGGGAGWDVADYSSRWQNLSISLDNWANDGAAGEGDNVETWIEEVRAGSGNDYISGHIYDQKFFGGGGNDVLVGDGGQDSLFGDGGDDRLYGGNGNDSIVGGAGVDWMYGDAGEDYLDGRESGNQTPDFIDGGTGWDWTEDSGDYLANIESVRTVY